MNQFECHITIAPSNADADNLLVIKKIVEHRGWNFSMIQGDPDLGAGLRCYATRWFGDEDYAISVTHAIKDEFVKKNLSVIRVKVEKVVHDARIVNGEWKEIR